MLIALSILALLVIMITAFMQQAPFGKLPSGERLEKIKKSPHYKMGQFQNLSHTPPLAEGTSFIKVLKDVLFGKSKRAKPAGILPSVKTDLLHLSPDQNILVWFGHSSYFMQIDGRKILVDPVFSGAASPLPASVKSFAGSNVYGTEDMPAIDYLFISHDHWDHLDFDTVKKLKPKIKRVITGLGTGAHLEHWGYDSSTILEKDWNEAIMLEQGFVVNTLPGRHFSGRGFRRQKSIWLSFALKTPSLNIFLGGDSGYDTHFKAIGDAFGPFDLAILECGQYHPNWKYIHSMPEELIKEAQELKAKKIMPVHWAKFVLALHAWDEPIKKISMLAKENNIPLVTPVIGEAVDLKDDQHVFAAWWENIL